MPVAGRRRAITPAPARPAAPLVVARRDPGLEHMIVLTRTLTWTLAATFATALGASLAGLAGTAAGWALVGTAGLAGLAPAGWYRLRAGRPGRLALWELDPGPARLVAEAAAEAEALRRLADRAPAGPVAEHLDHLAVTAAGYVVALHQAAAGARATTRGRPDRELDATLARIAGQLADLSSAAGRLREAQRRHLQGSVLDELVEATDRLTEAVESGQVR